MAGRLRTAAVIGVAALALVAGACGGSGDEDDASDTTVADPGGADGAPATSGDETSGDETSGNGSSVVGTGGSDDPAPDAAAGDDAAVNRCDELLGEDEVAELFGEPAELDPALTQAEPELGALLCSWATVEVASSADTSSQGLSLNVYSGDPVAGINFYDPTRETDVEPIEDLGDEAFLAHTTGIDTGVLDGERATLLSYFVVDLGDGSLEGRVSDAQVVELLRSVHGRAA
ncbi:MAG: hypothetical protein S0880_29820 [Actinomycetota bacterium]|nr:hypothetical protein [Actinomycetota bacterium]